MLKITSEYKNVTLAFLDDIFTSPKNCFEHLLRISVGMSMVDMLPRRFFSKQFELNLQSAQIGFVNKLRIVFCPIVVNLIA
jgi:hypothetical protein